MNPILNDEHPFRFVRRLACLMPLVLLGCGGPEKREDEFFTSGSREADQRAEQQIAKTEQIRGKGEGSDNNGRAVKKPLFDRLGGEAGIKAIVDDFVSRALADPRVNWERKVVKVGGLLKRDRSVEWSANEQNVARLKNHLAQFFALATGGPASYQGRDMKEVHKDLKITNAEFDASVGDLKATLDKLGVPTEEQKELLAVVESTRNQVAEER